MRGRHACSWPAIELVSGLQSTGAAGRPPMACPCPPETCGMVDMPPGPRLGPLRHTQPCPLQPPVAACCRLRPSGAPARPAAIGDRSPHSPPWPPPCRPAPTPAVAAGPHALPSFHPVQGDQPPLRASCSSMRKPGNAADRPAPSFLTQEQREALDAALSKKRAEQREHPHVIDCANLCVDAPLCPGVGSRHVAPMGRHAAVLRPHCGSCACLQSRHGVAALHIPTGGALCMRHCRSTCC